MSKPTLGRGLGDLLGANRATEDAPRDPAQPRAVDGGLRILIDGGARETEPAPTLAPATPLEEITKQPGYKILARGLVAALVGADLALLGWTAYHVITHQHALGLGGVALCVASTLMAAGCGVVAVRIIVSGE